MEQSELKEAMRRYQSPFKSRNQDGSVYDTGGAYICTPHHLSGKLIITALDELYQKYADIAEYESKYVHPRDRATEKEEAAPKQGGSGLLEAIKDEVAREHGSLTFGAFLFDTERVFEIMIAVNKIQERTTLAVGEAVKKEAHIKMYGIGEMNAENVARERIRSLSVQDIINSLNK